MTRRVEAEGLVIWMLSLAPVAAVTVRVEPERLTSAVSTVKVREAGGLDVPGRIGGPDVEGVGAVGEVGRGLRRAATRIAAGVELALEGGARLGGEAEGRGRVVGVPEGPAVIVVSGGPCRP